MIRVFQQLPSHNRWSVQEDSQPHTSLWRRKGVGNGGERGVVGWRREGSGVMEERGEWWDGGEGSGGMEERGE